MTNFYVRTKTIANFLLQNKTTIRETAKHFGMAKSTVHYDLSYRLKKIDPALYAEVKNLLEFNFQDKHNRGGEATKKMYLNLKSKKKIST